MGDCKITNVEIKSRALRSYTFPDTDDRVVALLRKTKLFRFGTRLRKANFYPRPSASDLLKRMINGISLSRLVERGSYFQVVLVWTYISPLIPQVPIV